VRSTHHLVFGRSKFLVRVFLRPDFAGLAWTGSCSESRCCNKAAHIRRHIATNKKTETSNSEVVTAVLMQDIQQYPLARIVPQLIGMFRRNAKSPFIVWARGARASLLAYRPYILPYISRVLGHVTCPRTRFTIYIQLIPYPTIHVIRIIKYISRVLGHI
jgi:hypothetical protein